MLVKAASRRSRARAARALTSVACSGIGLQSVMRISFRSDRQDAKLGSMPTTHCADLLTARENLRCCNVRSYQKKCDKALYYLTTDRGGALSCYQPVDVLCLVSRALFFDRLRSGKNREEHHESRFPASFVPSMCRLFG